MDKQTGGRTDGFAVAYTTLAKLRFGALENVWRLGNVRENTT